MSTGNHSLKPLTTMLHIGQEIRRVVEDRGRTSVWLARELGCHRTNLYKIYDKYPIDTGVLMHISRILDYNFFRLYVDELTASSKEILKSEHDRAIIQK